ncbi:hypothetical protein [Chitinophaga vietnamensis]|uniref:hypothetical protein n=1 Tax=Chitinophaga vietnamensis TaxID=2593957 RepID=UPI00117740C0|nr:hypothetical protein [Chitinophaga vietnamensis]
MGLQHLDIDSYINWYKELSYKLEFATDNEWRINRYFQTARDLYERYARDQKNIRSKELSEWLTAESNTLYGRVQEVRRYMKSDDLPDLWYVPPVSAWLDFDAALDDLVHSSTDFTTGGVQSLKEELKRINEKEWVFTNSVLINHPFYVLEIERAGEGWVKQLALFVRDCHLAKQLARHISTLETPAPENSGRLPWGGTAADLSELIKALSLTALKDVPEAEIISMLGPVFDINGEPFNEEAYHIHANEWQDKKPEDMFTAQLNNAVNNFLMNEKASQ